MKRFRIFFFALVFALPLTLTAKVSAEDAAPSPSSGGHAAPVPSQKTQTDTATRSVVKGDTLWQITQAAYGDPFVWPMLWEANKTLVDNPHLIYPGQIIALPSAEDLKKIKLSAAPPADAVPAKAVAAPVAEQDGTTASDSVSDETSAAEESKAVAPAETAGESAVSVDEAPPAAAQDEAVAPAEPALPAVVAPSAEPVLKTPDIKGQPRREARVVDSSFAPDGIVSGIMGDRLLVSQGDIVYVHFASIKPEVGKRLGIYRKMGRVRNPSDGRNLGDEIVRIGTLEIIELSADGAASARVVSSRDSVLIKDWVLAEK